MSNESALRAGYRPGVFTFLQPKQVAFSLISYCYFISILESFLKRNIAILSVKLACKYFPYVKNNSLYFPDVDIFSPEILRFLSPRMDSVELRTIMANNI